MGQVIREPNQLARKNVAQTFSAKQIVAADFDVTGSVAIGGSLTVTGALNATLAQANVTGLVAALDTITGDVSAAQGTADAAYGAAGDAQSAAAAAQSTADNANAAASSAANAAATAQATADSANTAAGNAASAAATAQATADSANTAAGNAATAAATAQGDVDALEGVVQANATADAARMDGLEGDLAAKADAANGVHTGTTTMAEFAFDNRGSGGTTGGQFYSFNHGNAWPTYYIGGTHPLVLCAFGRITSSANFYFGDDADGGGVVFRGLGGLQSQGAAAGTYTSAAYFGNSASVASANEVRVRMGPNADFDKNTAPYIGAYGVAGGYDTGIVEGIYVLASGTTVLTRKTLPTQHNALRVPNAAPADADIPSAFVAFYVDQAANKLMARVRYSDGTYKTAETALT